MYVVSNRTVRGDLRRLLLRESEDGPGPPRRKLNWLKRASHASAALLSLPTLPAVPALPTLPSPRLSSPCPGAEGERESVT